MGITTTRSWERSDGIIVSSQRHVLFLFFFYGWLCCCSPFFGCFNELDDWFISCLLVVREDENRPTLPLHSQLSHLDYWLSRRLTISQPSSQPTTLYHLLHSVHKRLLKLVITLHQPEPHPFTSFPVEPFGLLILPSSHHLTTFKPTNHFIPSTTFCP